MKFPLFLVFLLLILCVFLNLHGDGVGLNYHMGLFKQVFDHNFQKETPNPWIEKDSWLIKTNVSYPVSFGDLTVTSRMYDIEVTGYEGRTNKLHLFDVDTLDESLIKDGTISFDKTDIARNLTLFLYPAVFYGKQCSTLDFR